MRTFRQELKLFDKHKLDLLKVEIAWTVDYWKRDYEFLSNEETYEKICLFVYKYKLDENYDLDTHNIVEAVCLALYNNRITLDDLQNDYEKSTLEISYFLYRGW